MSNQQFNNDNSGALFRNDRKEKDNHPDHKGSAEIICPHCGKKSEWWLAAWVRTAKNSGARFFSIAFTDKAAQEQKQQAQNFSAFDKDEDVPF